MRRNTRSVTDDIKHQKEKHRCSCSNRHIIGCYEEDAFTIIKPSSEDRDGRNKNISMDTLAKLLKIAFNCFPHLQALVFFLPDLSIFLFFITCYSNKKDFLFLNLLKENTFYQLVPFFPKSTVVQRKSHISHTVEAS